MVPFSSQTGLWPYKRSTTALFYLLRLYQCPGEGPLYKYLASHLKPIRVGLHVVDSVDSLFHLGNHLGSGKSEVVIITLDYLVTSHVLGHGNIQEQHLEIRSQTN